MEGGFGDGVEILAGDFDAPTAFAGGFDFFPAGPADGGRCLNEDAEIEEFGDGFVERVDALDDDCGRGGDLAHALASVGVEGPDGRGGGLADAEGGEVLTQQPDIDVLGTIAVVVRKRVVVGEVIVGGEDAGGESAGEGALAGADGAGDAEEGDGVRVRACGGEEGGGGVVPGERGGRSGHGGG